MNTIDITKYKLTTPYLILSSDKEEHSKVKKEVLRSIDVIKQDGNGFINKLDWVESAKFNRREWIVEFYPHLLKYLNAAATALGMYELDIQNLWFQQYVTGNKHDWHMHSGQWVGVYYLELPEDSPKTDMIVPFLQNEKITPDVKEGDMLIFPSHVIHRCPLIENKKRKTIISWNFDIKEILPYTLETINKL
jgi:hypothetical protein